MMKNIVLLGIKHSGKSTLGKSLAKKMNINFFDTDDEITRLKSKTPRQIYNEEGKESFLQAEYLVCKNLINSLKVQNSVIATGGGICDNEPALKLLHNVSSFVFLNVPEETALNRILKEIEFNENIIANPSSLPAYIAKKNPHTKNDVRNIFHDFYLQRVETYKSTADYIVDLKKDSIESNTDKIFNCLDF